METKKLFIVSFGDSRKYRYEYIDRTEGTSMNHADPLKEVEKEMRDYLEKEFPGQSLTYYYTPKVTEVNMSDSSKFAEYPELDKIELEKLKADVKRQIEVRGADNLLDSDAPYSDISINR